MAIDVQCAGCGRRLEVDEQYAGQTLACPVCNASFQAPDAASAAAQQAEPAVWSLRIPEGRIFGPVTKTELDRWVSEGRISDDCQLHEEAGSSWRPADEVYPVLRAEAFARSPSRGNPFAPVPFYPAAAPAPAATGENHRPPYLAPHRGGLVLALSILAFPVMCPVLSFLAWTMGTNDLREMRQGRMDPSGMSMTQAGMVLGMLVSVAMILAIALLVFYVLFEIAL